MKVDITATMQVCGNNIKRYPNIWQYNRYNYKGLPMQQTIKSYVFLAIFSLQFPVEAMQLARLKEFQAQSSKAIVRTVYSVDINPKTVAIAVAATCALSLLSPHVRRYVKTQWKYGKLSHINAQDAAGNTALLLTQDSAMVEYLLKKCIDVTIANNAGETALMNALGNKRRDIIDLIKKHRPEYVQKVFNQEDLNRAFLEVVDAGDVESAQFLHDLGAEINATEIKIVPQMAMIDRRWRHEWSATLNLMTEHCVKETVIRPAGEKKQETQRTALMIAVANDNVRMMENLVAMGADVNKQNAYGRTALMLANSSDMVQELLWVPGIDINKEDKSGETALTRAIAHGQEDIVGRLLARKDCNITGRKNGQTLLMQSAERGNTAVMEKILEKIPDQVNEKNEYEWTALHRAASTGSPSIVRMLLHHGADITVLDKNDQTAEDIARDNERSVRDEQKKMYQEVIEVFEEFKKQSESAAV